MINNSIYIQYNQNGQYPNHKNSYSPNYHYPEYPWDDKDVSHESNYVYDMVRSCLHGLNYDSKHYDSPEWNPLGELIEPGNTVLIKPNWVYHENICPEAYQDLTCLVTHPSVIRVVVDYVIIALQGTGKIIIGDAPVQGADFQLLLKNAGYLPLFEFYQSKGINIQVVDFRKYSVEVKGGIITSQNPSKYGSSSINIDIGEQSLHAKYDNSKPVYKVTDYKATDTNWYHQSGKHSYSIAKDALEANVIINIPKPKCHRYAGMTAAMKNFIGIVYDKASLPHRKSGDAETGRGDAYYKKNINKERMEKYEESKLAYIEKGATKKAHIMNLLRKLCFFASNLTENDRYRDGGWYGNDTIWRTIIDINYIITFADRYGNLRDKKQRKVLTIGDMVICGEKSGPLTPSRKPLGVIMASENILLFDYIVCKIMGFNKDKIKYISCEDSIKRLFKVDTEQIDNEIIGSNLESIDQKTTGNISIPDEWHFIAHPDWKGYIELEGR